MLQGLIAWWLLGSMPARQSPQPTPLPQVEEAEIVVTGYPPRCRGRPDDPLDGVTRAAPTGGWVFIVEDSSGGYRYLRKSSKGAGGQTTRLDRWRRAGDQLPSFVFRQPAGHAPMCMGRRTGAPEGTAQLQQELDPTPYRCRTVRLTMFVATRTARAWLWLNNAAAKPVLVPVEGSHGWIPVRLEWGPIGAESLWLSFGAILQDGEVWLYDPKLEVLGDDQVSRTRQRRQAACRVDVERQAQRARWQPGVVAKEREADRSK